jgi:hypothetical protein
VSIYDVKIFPSIKINVIIVLCEYICDKSSIYLSECMLIIPLLKTNHLVNLSAYSKSKNNIVYGHI